MYEEQIAKGLVVAEQEYGKDFQIDCQKLNMASPRCCMLGQLEKQKFEDRTFADYFTASTRMAEKEGSPSGEWAAAHGFTLWGDGLDDWVTLTMEWRERLHASGHCADHE